MTEEITNLVLLQHVQAMKQELRADTRKLETKTERGFADVYAQLEDARKHRESLQEDLYETMRVQRSTARNLRTRDKD